MKRISLVLLVGAAMPIAGCATMKAKAPTERPTLEVPVPPGRVIEPMPRHEPATPEPVGDLPAAAPANPRPNSKPPVREPARSDPKPPETPVVETAPPPATPPAPAVQLRTPGSPDSAEAARQVRDILDSATKTLNSIDVKRFSKAKREQYNQARLLLTQSEDALKGSNFDNARKLAVKAEDIAKELQGR
jgi:hypothetical protein